jgi:hypothetical protein
MASKKKPKIKGLQRAKRMMQRKLTEEQRLERQGRQAIKERMAKRDRDITWVENNRKVKASPLVLEFGDPLIQPMIENPEPDPEAYQNGLRNVIAFVVMVWNLGTLPEDTPAVKEGRAILKKTMGQEPVMQDAIDMMIERKHEAFSEPIHQFFVHDHQVTFNQKGDMHLMVSTEEIKPPK